MPMRWRSSTRWARAATRSTQGIAELREVLDAGAARSACPKRDYALNFSIARGLDYYTGTVYETTLDDYPQIGSICSGGRYENLASHYTKSKLPGVGISIGADAPVLAVARSRPDRHGRQLGARCWSALMDEARPAGVRWTSPARCAPAGINTEVQLEPSKLAKQFQYADRAGIRFVVLCGEDEAHARRGDGQGPAPRRSSSKCRARSWSRPCGSSSNSSARMAGTLT